MIAPDLLAPAADLNDATLAPVTLDLDIRLVNTGPDATEADVETLVNAIVVAKARAEHDAAPWRKVEADAREALSAIMAATGRTDWNTPAGRAYVPAAGVTVSYDAKALDALCASSPELAAVLQPHRRESMRAGSLTIRGGR